MLWRSWKSYGSWGRVADWAFANPSTSISLNLSYMRSGANLRGGMEEDAAFSGLGWLLPVCWVVLLLHSSWNGFWFSLNPAQLGSFSITHGVVWVYLPHKHRTTEKFPSLAWLELLRHERFAGEHLAICFPHRVSLTTWEWPSVRMHRDRSYSISSGLQG